MRCDAVRQIVEEGMTKTPGVEVHMESCPGCKEYLGKWETLRTALVALRAEELPGPTFGFTARLMRRLENAPAEYPFGQQLIDQIARRAVYATLMVAFMLGLLLALPSSGPLRSSGISESILVQNQVARLANEQVLGVDGVDAGDVDDLPASGNSTEAQGSR
jgi:anti-sigma factor RsiW